MSQKDQRVLTYVEAINEATEAEMKRDKRVFLFGLDVDDHKAILGTTKGLLEKFGKIRVFGTPLSEDAMSGVAIGAAIAGLRPIHVHIRMDFLMLAMNQLVNMAAKSSYMFGGSYGIPLVVRSIIGRSWGQGAQHSQGLHAMLAHVPGLKVVAPSTPYDAKGCLIQAIRDDNPVMFVEHRMLYNLKSEVPEKSYTVPFGKARILTSGSDVTLVGISYMVVECLRAREYLENIGISAEVIDPISLSPLDIDTILESVSRTGNMVVVDTGWTNCGISNEIVAQISERLGSLKKIRVRAMGYAPVPCPTTKNLENLFYPNAQTIASNAYAIVKKTDERSSSSNKRWIPEITEAPEITQFKGPF